MWLNAQSNSGITGWVCGLKGKKFRKALPFVPLCSKLGIRILGLYLFQMGLLSFKQQMNNGVLSSRYLSFTCFLRCPFKNGVIY